MRISSPLHPKAAPLYKLSYNPNMPAFTIYGSRGSSNTDRIRLMLAEGGITDYELVLLDLRKGEQKSAENLSRNPWGKIPVLTLPNGFTLYESRPICKYLARKYSLSLLPSDSDLEAAALLEQAESVEAQYFAEPAGTIGFEKYVKQFMNLPADEAAVSKAEKALEAYFDVAEKLLQQKSFMAGNEFTLADIYYIPLVQRLFLCGYGETITSRRAVSAWWERITGRPAIQKIMAADKAAQAAGGR